MAKKKGEGKKVVEQAKVEKKVEQPKNVQAKVKVDKKPKKEKTGPTITRVHAAALAIKAINGETTIKDIIAATDKIFIKHGGSANEKESHTQVKKALKILDAFDLIKVEGDKVKKVQQ